MFRAVLLLIIREIDSV